MLYRTTPRQRRTFTDECIRFTIRGDAEWFIGARGFDDRGTGTAEGAGEGLYVVALLRGFGSVGIVIRVCGNVLDGFGVVGLVVSVCDTQGGDFLVIVRFIDVACRGKSRRSCS